MQTNPYSVTMRYFTERENVDRHKLDMAIHVQEKTREPLSEAEFFLRCEARQTAILALWGLEETILRQGITVSSVNVLYRSAEMTCRQNNPYPGRPERAQWEREFKAEIDSRVDDLLATIGRLQ